VSRAIVGKFQAVESLFHRNSFVSQFSSLSHDINDVFHS
jgi:hypothetical protein